MPSKTPEGVKSNVIVKDLKYVQSEIFSKLSTLTP